MLCELLDACEVHGTWPTLRKIIYLAKYATDLFDCSMDKHVDDQALADCKALVQCHCYVCAIKLMEVVCSCVQNAK